MPATRMSAPGPLWQVRGLRRPRTRALPAWHPPAACLTRATGALPDAGYVPRRYVDCAAPAVSREPPDSPAAAYCRCHDCLVQAP